MIQNCIDFSLEGKLFHKTPKMFRSPLVYPTHLTLCSDVIRKRSERT